MQKIGLAIIFFAMPAVVMADVPDARNYSGPAWSPYLVGGLIGMLTWLTLVFSDKPVGASSAYATAAGLIGNLFARKHTNSLDYYKKNPPKPGWEFVFVLSAVVGAFIAALTGGEITNRTLPPFWEERFGARTVALRLGVGFPDGSV